MRAITTIAVHCSAARYGGVAEIREYHTRPKPEGKGWIDVGYHYIVTREGDIQLGRPMEIQGAHVGKPYNADSIGVCWVGGNIWAERNPDAGLPDGPYVAPTNPQLDALRLVVNGLRFTYGVALRRVLGHREFPGVTKTCPGTGFDMDAFREGLRV